MSILPVETRVPNSGLPGPAGFSGEAVLSLVEVMRPLNDAQFAQIERDVASFGQSGAMSARLRRVITRAGVVF